MRLDYSGWNFLADSSDLNARTSGIFGYRGNIDFPGDFNQIHIFGSKVALYDSIGLIAMQSTPRKVSIQLQALIIPWYLRRRRGSRR